MANSLIIGGKSGIGLVVKEVLKDRGDNVYTASRRQDKSDRKHLRIDLPDSFKSILSTKWDNLIFTHRYRGDNWASEFDITVKSINLMVNSLKENLNANASIVILGSQASKYIYSEQGAAYHSSRAALEGLVKFLAVNLGKKTIRCNLVNPPTLLKPENKKFFHPDNKTRQVLEQITPLSRMGRSEDIANLIEFLCSDKSSFITGQSFNVDGGLSLVAQESVVKLYEKEGKNIL